MGYTFFSGIGILTFRGLVFLVLFSSQAVGIYC